MTSSIFDVTSFSTFSYKNTSTGEIYLKIGRIIDFDVKKCIGAEIWTVDAYQEELFYNVDKFI